MKNQIFHMKIVVGIYVCMEFYHSREKEEQSL